MKNIMKPAIAAIAALFAMSACDTDIDSNPILDLSRAAEGFTLNAPGNAANNTYDLASAEKINLTTSQPDYGGVPYATRYFVQVAIDRGFAEGGKDIPFKELSTSYTTARMAVDAREMNDAIVALFQEANPDTDFPTTPMKAYVRLRAVINGVELGQTFSNVVELPSVLASYVAPDAVLPTELFVVGSNIQTPWSSWKPMPQVYGMAGHYYTMIYMPENGAFKWGTFNNDWRGYDRLRNIADNAGANLTEGENSNIVVGKAGWYVLHFTGEIVGKSIQYDLAVEPGKAYVIGAAAGDAWNDGDPNWELQAPADENGLWKSPALAGAGELRAYVKVPGFDWWRTEFTLHGGGLVFRTMDIPSNWAENVGADYSVQTTQGQTLYIDFNNNKGEVK